MYIGVPNPFHPNQSNMQSCMNSVPTPDDFNKEHKNTVTHVYSQHTIFMVGNIYIYVYIYTHIFMLCIQ